jgi:hypothetical protein
MPDPKPPAGAPAGDPAPDSFEGWTDEEKAEWEASAKYRERAADDMAARLFDKLFAEPEGGGVVGPDGKAAEPTPGAPAGAPPAGLASGPWWDRKIIGLRRKPKAPPAPPAPAA